MQEKIENLDDDDDWANGIRLFHVLHANTNVEEAVTEAGVDGSFFS